MQALEKGVEGAYKAVMKPTEGTMLTVARVASEEAAASGIADAVELWQLVCTAAQRALDNTPEQLPVLKKAGVVDAGGQGLVYIFEGMLSVFKDNHIIAADEAPEKSAKLSTSGAGKGVYTDDLMKVEDIKNGYCTQFLVNKNDGASSNKLRAFLESNGDSVVVIEDDEVINCHVHTADPGKIVSHALQYGYLTNFKIENMHEQFLSRQAQGEGLKKRQAAAEFIVERLDQFVHDNMGWHFDQFIPLVGAIFALSIGCNLISVVGLWSPTADLNTEAAWAIVVFIIIMYYKIKTNGILAYLKGLLDPIFLMAPINVLSEVSTPVSMAFRHFGNILSGTVISTLLYWALASLSHVIFGWLPGFLSQLQLFQIGIPAFTGLYFDWFGGCIQAFIFCTLTTIFIKRAAGEE
mgnify:CR=1 FL=1